MMGCRMEAADRQRSAAARVLLHLSIVILSVAFSLVAAELVVRFFYPSPVKEGFFIWPPNLQMTFTPSDRIMPGVSGPSVFRVNSYGIRGEEVLSKHRIRILAIGGSTTECLYLDQKETWPYLVQEKLNAAIGEEAVWVGNAGKSGMSTNNHIVALKYLPMEELRIDMILLLVGINDFSKRLARGDGSAGHGRGTPRSEQDFIAETFVGKNRFYEKDPFLKRTRIWQLLRQLKKRIGGKKTQDKSGEVYLAWRENRKNAGRFIEDLPDLSNALEEYGNNIEKLIEIARRRSIELIFMTQPTLWRTDMPESQKRLLWFGGIGDFQEKAGMPYYTAEALEKGIRLYNEALQRACKKRNVRLIDLARTVDKTPEHFYDDVHFSEGGARRVAQVVSAYLQDLLLAEYRNQIQRDD